MEELVLTAQKSAESSPVKGNGRQSLISRLKQWKMKKYVVVSLEKIGDKSGQIQQAQPDPKYPAHVGTGLALGTKSMLTKVFSAVAGVIVEPVKGAKEGGVKGGAVGFGKGMLGLVCKPVKGTIDLVTQTTRGISNTPKTMYVGMTRMIKKVPGKKEPESDEVSG